MSANFVLFLPVLLQAAAGDLSDYIRLDHDTGDILKPKQPLIAQRDGRFLRLDSGDSEIELEFGVSVPFAKFPLPGARGGEHNGHPEDHRVAVNPAGLLVGATLLLTSFLLVPLVVPAEPPHRRKVAKMPYEGGRSWGTKLWSEVDEVLSASNLHPRSCTMKAVCVLANQTSITPPILNYISRLDFVQKMVAPLSSESCDESYPTCSVSAEMLKEIPSYIPGFQ